MLAFAYERGYLLEDSIGPLVLAPLRERSAAVVLLSLTLTCASRYSSERRAPRRPSQHWIAPRNLRREKKDMESILTFDSLVYIVFLAAKSGGEHLQ